MPFTKLIFKDLTEGPAPMGSALPKADEVGVEPYMGRFGKEHFALASLWSTHTLYLFLYPRLRDKKVRLP
jgi:hypothetical protein